MNHREQSESGMAVAVVILLLLLLVVGGGGWFFFRTRQLAARAEMERAMALEAQAREAAVRAQKEKQLYLDAMAETPVENAQTADQSTADGNQDLETSLRAVLDAQARAWNEGDIDRFMEHYWRSENLSFSSGGKTTRGWKNTLDNYKQRYPTAEKMGTLTFDHLESTLLGDDTALVLGRWRLQRADPVVGGFTLIFRKHDRRWVIIHDHTSRLTTDKDEP